MPVPDLMQTPSPAALSVLGCRDCPAGRGPFIFDKGTVRCPACLVTWPVGPHGAVNSLTHPAPSVLREIDGMRQEHSDRFPTRESFFFQKVERVSRLDERIAAASPPGEWRNYYRSTEVNFQHGFQPLKLTGSECVLE